MPAVTWVSSIIMSVNSSDLLRFQYNLVTGNCLIAELLSSQFHLLIRYVN